MLSSDLTEAKWPVTWAITYNPLTVVEFHYKFVVGRTNFAVAGTVAPAIVNPADVFTAEDTF